MFDDLDCDSFDDHLLPPVTTKDRSSSKFRPKARPNKPVKVAAAAPKTSDATCIVPAPPESVAPDLDANHELEQAALLPSASNSSTVGCEHQSMQKSEQQPEVIQAESVESRDEFIQHPQQNKKKLVQDVDSCSSMDSPNELLMTTGSGSLDDYQRKALPQSENKEHIMSPAVVSEVEESFCASILTSSYPQTESPRTEISEAQPPLQPEEVVSQEASQGGVYVQDGDIDMHSNLDQSKQVSAEFPDVESPTGLFPCGTTAVTQVGRFQPKKGKLCTKEAKPKSVSFILPDASHSAAPVESFPGRMDPSSMQVMNDRPADNPLCSSNTNSDWSREPQVDHRTTEYENRQDDGLPKILEDVHMEPQSQDVRELEQQILDDRTTTENDDDGGASISSGTVMKRRITEKKTGEIQSRGNNSSGTDNLHVSEEINGSQSDERCGDEEMPRPKRAKRKPKKQTTEIEKPARSKKVSEKSNSAVENSPKKKFPHSTRRKRRQVDKVLLQTPEEEIDPRQISIKNLIMLAEAKERMSAKEGAPMSKLFSNRSTSSFSNNENTLFGEDENMLFGEDEEWNHRGEEENHNVQQAPKKLNYHTYMNREPNGRWSKSETELLYEAIRQFGSDFAMIQQLFPNRTRHQIKLKFKIEERKHPTLVHDALLHRSKDLSHVMQVIKQLQTRAEPTSKGEDNSDQMNTLQDGVGKDEEETGGSQMDEEQQQYGREGEDKGPEEFIDSKGGVNSPDVNDDGSVYDWDSGAYSQDAEEDSMWVI